VCLQQRHQAAAMLPVAISLWTLIIVTVNISSVCVMSASHHQLSVAAVSAISIVCIVFVIVIFVLLSVFIVRKRFVVLQKCVCVDKCKNPTEVKYDVTVIYADVWWIHFLVFSCLRLPPESCLPMHLLGQHGQAVGLWNDALNTGGQ